jgi:hypothetical protein
VIEPKPAAVLIPIDPNPRPRGDGPTIQLFRTDKGIIHARVVHPNGAIEWFQKIAG